MTHGHLRRAARVALGAAMVGFVIGAGAQEPQGSPPNGQSGISRQHVDERGIPRFIEGRLGLLRGDAHHRDSDIRSFLQTYAGSLRADGSESLAIRRAHKDAAIGKRHYRASQRINGLDVVGGEIIFHVDEQTAEIYAIDAQFLPGTGLPRAPLVRAQAVAGLIAADVGIELDPTDKHDPHLVYLRRATGAGLLAWKLEVSFSDREGARQILDVYVDILSCKRPRIAACTTSLTRPRGICS